MGKIKILPEYLANKIAAGEVVERPASIVKELIENSLDAASRKIEIIIEDGGRSLIKVIDDGQGMDEKDLKQSCLPHATSKIYTEEDLNNIRTLGFRGEALASIAAVSLLKITSAQAAQENAWQLTIEAGAVKNIQQEARTRGTTVEVRNLFFNTPARLKFLKTNSTELAHIIRTVTELALAYPEVSFRLFSHREEIINCSVHKEKIERIKALLPDNIAQELLPVSFNIAPLKINAFLSKPGKGFSTRKNQYLFVNGRCVTDKIISHAIMQGYQRALMERQFPAVIIFIETNPALVDVNVHPGKKEVRFQEASLVHDCLVKLIKDGLIDKNNFPDLPKFLNLPNSPNLSLDDYSDIDNNQPHQRIRLKTENIKELSLDNQVREEFVFANIAKDECTSKKISDILQAKNTYLIYPDKAGVIVIDQHAAHERILFDELLSQFQNKKIEKQKLLIPITLSLKKDEFLIIQESQNFFKELGFDLEEFGAQTIAVYSYPAVLENIDIAEQLNKIITELTLLEISADLEKRVNQLLASIACHCAIKAGEKLTPEQINSLLARLWQTKFPYTCPHGRPTLVRIDWYEMERKFKRK
ncbi:MAG: DNA mismatch repair endonuclease MutL [Candidatus Omnitrophota bacterium]